jgi:hypothetical protein
MQQPQLYADFPTVTAKISSNSNMAFGTNAPSPLSTAIASMNSIHQAITDLPLSEDTADGQHRHKRMWTLSEVPSCCEDDTPASNGHLTLKRSSSYVERRSGTHRASGQVNSAYIKDPVVLEYTEDDDDVFVSGTVATLSPKMTGCNEKSSIRNTVMKNGNDITQSLGKLLISHKPVEQFELDVRYKVSVLSGDSEDTGIPESNSSSHPGGPITDDVDINNTSLDDNDKTELSPSHCRMKGVIVASSEEIRCNSAKVLRFDSENNVGSAEINKNNRTSTSSENLRLSPLKIVGEFLFHANLKKSTCLKE